MNRLGRFNKSHPGIIERVIVDFLADKDADVELENRKALVGALGQMVAFSGVDPEKSLDISLSLLGMDKQDKNFGQVEQWMRSDTPEEYKRNLQTVMKDVKEWERKRAMIGADN